MRAVMISFTIILFCFAGDIVNQVELEFFSEMERPLFGWTFTPPINEVDLGDAASESNFNTSARDALTPQEQPSGLGLDSLISGVVFILKGGWMIFSALFNSTVGFFWWIQDLGRSDFTFVPYDMAVKISAIVYVVYLAAIYQWLTNRSLRQGG